MTHKDNIVLILKAAGLKRLLKSNTAYTAATNPNSSTFDPDLPRTVALGSAPNSPKAFLQHEIDAYLEKVVARSRSTTLHAETCTAHAKRLVAARQSRRAAN